MKSLRIKDVEKKDCFLVTTELGDKYLRYCSGNTVEWYNVYPSTFEISLDSVGLEEAYRNYVAYITSFGVY